MHSFSLLLGKVTFGAEKFKYIVYTGNEKDFYMGGENWLLKGK